jgi:hypothetical protein
MFNIIVATATVKMWNFAEFQLQASTWQLLNTVSIVVNLQLQHKYGLYVNFIATLSVHFHSTVQISGVDGESNFNKPNPASHVTSHSDAAASRF